MLIILFPYKFTEFQYLRLGLDFFEKNLKTKFEVHDLSKVVNPSWDKAFLLKRHKKTFIFDTLSNWESHLNNLTKKNKNLTVFNFLDTNSFKSIFVLLKLKNYTKQILQLGSTGHPNFFYEKKSKLNFQIFFKKLSNISKNPQALYFFLKSKICKKISKLIKFEEVYILHNGSIKNSTNILRSKKKFFIKYHSHDFLRMQYFLKKKYNPKIKKPYVVFLDIPTPYFKGDYDLFGKKINYDIEMWYKNLNSFLDLIKKKYSCNILMIPHPKVKKQKNPFYKKNFEVVNDLDAAHKLIPSSKFVISIGASTAIGIASATNKPILLIYNNQIKDFNPGLFEEIKFTSKIYRTSLININNFKTKNLIKPVNKQYNEKLKYKYMTSEEIKNTQNFQILNKILNQ